jgi:hypothetical protein
MSTAVEALEMRNAMRLIHRVSNDADEAWRVACYQGIGRLVLKGLRSARGLRFDDFLSGAEGLLELLEAENSTHEEYTSAWQSLCREFLDSQTHLPTFAPKEIE